MIPGIDPKIDYAFKRVFGRERNRGILLHLLNAILQPCGHALITDLELLNPFNDKETSDDKLSIVDLIARDQLGRRFHVEMQMLANLVFPNRLLYYWSRQHSLQLSEGEDFVRLQPTISIGFVNDRLYPDHPNYQWRFQLRADQHPDMVFSTHLEIHLLELPKFQSSAEDLHTPLQQWLYFLLHAPRLDSDVLPPTLQVPEIQKALEELIMVTQSERDRARYEERFMAELDARSFQSSHEATGHQKGFSKGFSAGLAERFQWCQGLLKQPQTPTGELLALPLEELQRQTALLEQQVADAFRQLNGAS